MAESKVKDSEFFGMRVELSNGKYLEIDGFGISDVEKNFATLEALVADFMNMSDQDQKKVKNSEKAKKEFIQRQFNRIRALIESSIVGGNIELDQVRGLHNLMDIALAVIKVNDLFGAVGKFLDAMGEMNEAMSQQGMTMMNPTGSQTSTPPTS